MKHVLEMKVSSTVYRDLSEINFCFIARCSNIREMVIVNVKYVYMLSLLHTDNNKSNSKAKMIVNVNSCSIIRTPDPKCLK